MHTHTSSCVPNSRRPSQACTLFFCASPLTMYLSRQPGSGAAQRRRRHEQQSIAAVVATFQHHSGPRRPNRARTGYGDRRLIHRGCGQASLRSLRRRGVTAAGDTRQGTPSRPSACWCWLGRRERQWTPPRSASSQLLRWKPRGNWRRRRRRSRNGSVASSLLSWMCPVTAQHSRVQMLTVWAKRKKKKLYTQNIRRFPGLVVVVVKISRTH